MVAFCDDSSCLLFAFPDFLDSWCCQKVFTIVLTLCNDCFRWLFMMSASAALLSVHADCILIKSADSFYLQYTLVASVKNFPQQLELTDRRGRSCSPSAYSVKSLHTKSVTQIDVSKAKITTSSRLLTLIPTIAN